MLHCKIMFSLGSSLWPSCLRLKIMSKLILMHIGSSTLMVENTLIDFMRAVLMLFLAMNYRH